MLKRSLATVSVGKILGISRHAAMKVLASAFCVFFCLPGVSVSQDVLKLALEGDVEALRLALPAGSKPDPETLVRPTYFAAQRGHSDFVEYLLGVGATPDSMTDFGSALQIAARNNHADIVSMLLDEGADPNTRGGDFGNAPIHDAAERGAMDAAKVLLARGADVNLRRDTGNQPAIHLAVKKGRSEMVALLLESGASALVPAPVTEREFEATDPELGRARAEECLFCHSIENGKQPSTKFAGPDLAGFLGGDKAVREYFDYSDAMRTESGFWTIEELNKFISDPTGAVPGTTMERGAVSDRVERLAVIKYLKNAANAR